MIIPFCRYTLPQITPHISTEAFFLANIATSMTTHADLSDYPQSAAPVLQKSIITSPFLDIL
jgi:hypothetical protein